MHHLEQGMVISHCSYELPDHFAQRKIGARRPKFGLEKMQVHYYYQIKLWQILVVVGTKNLYDTQDAGTNGLPSTKHVQEQSALSRSMLLAKPLGKH